jgi:cytidylate kinase
VAARVVAISRTSGGGGEAVGRMVSERLGFRYVDEEIVEAAAAKGGVDPNLVADEEKRKGLLARLVGGLARAGMDVGSATATVPITAELRGSDDYRALILEAIARTADEGGVVIVAHAASMALAGRDGVLRVLVTAPADVRARRLAEAGEGDTTVATRSVQRDDAARAHYLKRFHGIDQELPTHYDVVINTDGLGFDQAAGIVLRAAEGIGQSS